MPMEFRHALGRVAAQVVAQWTGNRRCTVDQPEESPPVVSQAVVSQWSDHAERQLHARAVSTAVTSRLPRSFPCRPASIERCFVLAADRYDPSINTYSRRYSW